jgi:uncharacterized protein (TIGR00251 family)
VILRGSTFVIPVTESKGAATFAVRVVPRAGRTAIAGRRGDALLVRLSAAPVDGAANDALLDLLASALRRPRRDLSIASGDRSRSKRVAVSGMSAAEVLAALSAILPA